MDEQKQEIVRQEKQEKPETLAAYIRRPEITEKFALVLGGNQNAMRYIQSVVLVYETAEPGKFSLKNCTMRSIVRSALRAATQRVSVDPVDREAYLIPRNVKRNGVEEQEACFQFHYQEIYNRAMRTGRYVVINVSPIYEGTTVYENIYTGLHVLEMSNGLQVSNESASALRKWGENDGKKRIGWLGYYKMVGRAGNEKTVYMTIADIENQVHKAPGGGGGFGWSKFRDTMERKTVLLALLKMADLKTVEMDAVKTALDTIDQAESEETGAEITGELTTIEGYAEEIKAEPAPQKTTGDPLGDIGFEPEQKKEQPAPQPQPEAQPATPAALKYTPAQFKQKFGELRSKKAGQECKPTERNVCAAALTKILPEQVDRYALCRWLTGIASTKEMTGATILTLLETMSVKSFGDEPSDSSRRYLIACHAEALKDGGQMEIQNAGPDVGDGENMGA